uniref:hypothetical protein n=1 Tax=uncultured Amaricoccus sp. TaxID=339341 RepID=UPI00262B21EC
QPAERMRPDQRYALVGVKLYADGALGSRGAALLEPYYDRPGHNIFEQARVDFDSKRGPTADDVMDFITGKQADSHHWDVLQ